jgi:lipopolysaccharide biosynthesis regulator YciM
MRNVLSLILLFISFYSFSIDSLKVERYNKRIADLMQKDSVNTACQGLTKLANLYEYAGDWGMYNSTMDRLKVYASKQNNALYIQEYCNKIAMKYSLRGENTTALIHFNKALVLAKQRKNNHSIAKN